MRGEVLEFDAATGGGVIGDRYGARYTFDASVVRSPLSLGEEVEFNAANGVVTDIQRVTQAAQTASDWSQGSSPRAPDPDAPYDIQTAMFSFNGRLRRSHYWITWAITFGLGFISGFIPLIGFVLSLALIWPVLAKDVKRLHDMGHSGWWAAIPFGVGFVGMTVVVVHIFMSGLYNLAALERGDPQALVALFGPALSIFSLIGVVQIGFWLWFGIQDSQRGQNAYGPNPKGE